MDWQKFENFIVDLMERENIVGAAVAVSKGDELIYQKGFGFRDKENKLPVTPNTVMGIASVSKSFTAVEIMRLMDEGLLSLNDPVVKHLPDFSLAGHDASKVEVRHLLSHSTGLPPLKRKQEHLRFSSHLNYIKEYKTELLGPPGEYYSYSNDCFLLLGAIIERYRPYLYARQMTNLLGMLGMHNSTFYPVEADKFSEVTKNYIEENGEIRTAPWPQLGVYEAGGGVRSTALDLIKYGRMFINHGMSGETKVMSEKSFRAMLTPQVAVTSNEDYCSAIMEQRTQEFTLYHHSGSQAGVSSAFGFVLEEELVVSVLLNTTGKPAKHILMAAVRNALGLPLTVEEEVKNLPLSEKEALSLVGYYAADEGGEIVVYWDGKALRGNSRGAQYTLLRQTDCDFRVAENTYGLFARFYGDKQNPARAVRLGSRVLLRRD